METHAKASACEKTPFVEANVNSHDTRLFVLSKLSDLGRKSIAGEYMVPIEGPYRLKVCVVHGHKNIPGRVDSGDTASIRINSIPYPFDENQAALIAITIKATDGLTQESGRESDWQRILSFLEQNLVGDRRRSFGINLSTSDFQAPDIFAAAIARAADQSVYVKRAYAEMGTVLEAMKLDMIAERHKRSDNIPSLAYTKACLADACCEITNQQARFYREKREWIEDLLCRAKLPVPTELLGSMWAQYTVVLPAGSMYQELLRLFGSVPLPAVGYTNGSDTVFLSDYYSYPPVDRGAPLDSLCRTVSVPNPYSIKGNLYVFPWGDHPVLRGGMRSDAWLETPPFSFRSAVMTDGAYRGKTPVEEFDLAMAVRSSGLDSLRENGPKTVRNAIRKGGGRDDYTYLSAEVLCDEELAGQVVNRRADWAYDNP